MAKFKYHVVLPDGSEYLTETKAEALYLERTGAQMLAGEMDENPRRPPRQVATVAGRDPRNPPDGTILRRDNLIVVFDHVNGVDKYYVIMPMAIAGTYTSLSAAVRRHLNVPAYNGYQYFGLQNGFTNRNRFYDSRFSPEGLEQWRAVAGQPRTDGWALGRAAAAAPRTATPRAAAAAAPAPAAPAPAPVAAAAADAGMAVVVRRGQYVSQQDMYDALWNAGIRMGFGPESNRRAARASDFYEVQNYMNANGYTSNDNALRDLTLRDIIGAAIGAGFTLYNVPEWYTAAAPAAPAPAPVAAAAAPAAQLDVDPILRHATQQLEGVRRYFDAAGIQGQTQQNAPFRDLLADSPALKRRLVNSGVIDEQQQALRDVRLSDLVRAAQEAGYQLQNVPPAILAAAAAPAAAAPAAAAAAPAARTRRASARGLGPRRTPADSAAQFPRRCVGSPTTYEFGDARNASRNIEYMLTMIAPVCKQAMRVGKKNSQYEWRHVLYAPDKSVFYSGGYEGDITVISNRQFARQHMLPGVINAGADTGKGCGPAAYMAGPFVAVRRAPSAAGVYSIPGGRSGAAEAAWENALRHRTASNLPRGTERTVNVPVQDLVSFAKDNNMPRISNEGFQLITDVEPQIEVQIRGANSVYNVIYTLTILKLGIIVHMTPDQESAVIRSLPPNSVSSPFVPPPGIWRQLDLANFGSDDNFLLECLDYCARKFEEFGGGISSQDYLRTALTGLRDNPSLLPPVEWVDRQLAQIGGRTARLAANPSVRSAAVQAAEQRVSAFLNDPTWVSYGGVENPRR